MPLHAYTHAAGTQRYWIEEPTSPDDILGHATIQRALDKFQINVCVLPFHMWQQQHVSLVSRCGKARTHTAVCC